MARTYHTLAPARYQVREGVRGGWYVVDTNPPTYSRFEDGRAYFKDAFAVIMKPVKGSAYGQYFRTYNGAANLAQRLEAAAK
jgi:hypothetical protein